MCECVRPGVWEICKYLAYPLFCHTGIHLFALCYLVVCVCSCFCTWRCWRELKIRKEPEEHDIIRTEVPLLVSCLRSGAYPWGPKAPPSSFPNPTHILTLPWRDPMLLSLPPLSDQPYRYISTSRLSRGPTVTRSPHLLVDQLSHCPIKTHTTTWTIHHIVSILICTCYPDYTVSSVFFRDTNLKDIVERISDFTQKKRVSWGETDHLAPTRPKAWADSSSRDNISFLSISEGCSGQRSQRRSSDHGEVRCGRWQTAVTPNIFKFDTNGLKITVDVGLDLQD